MKPLYLLAFLTAFASTAPAQAPRQTRNLVLVTVDGLRWQEVFRGMDPALAASAETGMAEAEGVRERFAADTADERRRRLFPFLWSTVAESGVLLGNRDRGSRVDVANGHLFSYPGYSEILTGKTQDEAIASNDLQPNPSVTALEVLQRELDLAPHQIAVFASWEVFRGIASSGAGDFLINAGYQDLEIESPTPRLADLSRSQHWLLTPWRSVRHDYHTFELALEYLRSHTPRVLYLALGEPDDWAHEGRYDRVLETAHYFDQCLGRLWAAIESNVEYQGKTTMIVTTDHGRGRTPEDWRSHGAKVAGAEEIWIAAIGPDTPARGDVPDSAPALQADIAPTMLTLLGVSYQKLSGVQGKPLPLLIGE